jgi:hypothetical protein
MKTNQPTVTAILTIMFLACVVTIANAQSAFQGKFELKEEVRWGATFLPKGEYFLTIDSMQAPMRAIVRSADGHKAIFVTTRSVNDAEQGSNAISLKNNGEYWEVRSLNLPQLGVSLSYQPLQRAAGKDTDRAAMQTIPVVAAGR